MKVRINRLPKPLTFSEFSQLHNLTLIVTERDPVKTKLKQWTAKFEGVHITDGDLLKSEYGDGVTIAYAILDYRSRLRGKIIQRGDGSQTRITCPNEWASEDFSEWNRE